MSTNPKHLGLGTITNALGINRTRPKDILALGAGSVAAITLGDLIQSRLLVRNGMPVVPMAMAPAFSAAFGIVLGGLAKKKGYHNVGDGMIAGGVGVGISALIAKVTNPAVAASTAAASATEAAGAESQQVSGFGFGRAFARGLGGLAGLGAQRDPSLLFGVGTPDMSGANMFNGATVAVEEPSMLHGATVAIENPNAFASSLY